MSRSRTSDSLLPDTRSETNEGEDASRGSPASESVRSEGGAAHHGPHRSEEHRPGKRKMEEWGQIAPSPTEQKEAEAGQKNQSGKASAAIVGEGFKASAAAPPLRYPPFPRTSKLKDIRNWRKECQRISKILEKDIDDDDIPTMSKPNDPCTTEAVQSLKDKEVVLRAAHSIVMVSYIMDDGRREPQCNGIIIKQLSDGSGHHRAMVMTYCGVVCISGQIRDPLPNVQTFPFSACRLSVARPILGIDIRTIALLNVQLLEDIYRFGIKDGFLVDKVYNPVAQELGVKRGNVIISINGRAAVRLPELEDYFLSLGWVYLMDKSTCVKEFKLSVFDLKSRVQRDVTVPVGYYDKPERMGTLPRWASDDLS